MTMFALKAMLANTTHRTTMGIVITKGWVITKGAPS
jgi:hypothetical protein